MSRARPALRRVGVLWRTPLYRSGYLLVANAAMTSLAGLGFWAIVARLYPPEVVGENTAAISAMMFLAGIAQLNMMSALLRFLPTSGSSARRMIRAAFAVGAGLSGLAAVVFLAGLRHWSPGLVGLLHHRLVAVGFVLATMGWALFVMQDTALVALGRAFAVPLENLGFSLVKILAVVALATMLPGSGILAAWAGGMGVAVLATQWYLFRRAVPGFTRGARPSDHAPSMRVLGRYIGPDYLSSIAWLACTTLVPLLVLSLAGARHAAVFALAWLVGTALYDAPAAFGQSLIANGVVDRPSLDKHFRDVRRHTLLLLVPAVLVLVALAPIVLRIFGPYYAQHGVLALQLLALSAIPNTEVSLAVNRARAASEMRTVLMSMLALAAIVFGLTLLLVPPLGIAGAAWAWLAAQTAVAAGLILLRRSARVLPARLGALPSLLRIRASGSTRAAVRHALATAPGHWQVERPVPTVADTAVVLVRSGRGVPGVLKMGTTLRGAESLRREVSILGQLRGEERLGAWRALLPEVLESAQDEALSYLVASRLPGLDARGRACDAVVALDAIAPLHRLHARVAIADGELLARWVDEPAAVLRRAVSPRSGPAVDELVDLIHTCVTGREVPLGWTHGDFYPGNLMLVGAGRVSGIIDWGQARADDLTTLDATHWLLTASDSHQEMGRQVVDRLTSECCWSPAEWELLRRGQDLDPLPGPPLLLLSWLRHVTDNLTKSDRYLVSPIWLHRNVIPVLHVVKGKLARYV